MSVDVTCSGCGQATTVPFTPTPGRPVYCRACFAKRSPAPGRPAPSFGGGERSERPFRDASTQRKRMMAQGRKAHFVYDAKEVLERGKMVEENRRVFIEMLFTRGTRQSTAAAHDFLDEKVADSTITKDEARALGQLVERYSFYR